MTSATPHQNESNDTPQNWFDETRRLTVSLVRMRSVSPGVGENACAEEVIRLLGEDDRAGAYTAIGLDPIVGDPHERNNAYAFLRGKSSRTLVLLGHIDTVGTEDYGPLEPWATEPDELGKRLDQLAALAPEIRTDLDAGPGDWLFGRGIVDMKSGVATNLAIMRYYARRQRDTGEPPPLSLVTLATPDEENESAGVLQGVRFLQRLADEQSLQYVGAINTDYITSAYPGDPNWYVFTGSIGKMLPSFFVVGRESHVGDPFDGVDANLLMADLIHDLSMNPDLCEAVNGQLTPAPVTLRATDLKDTYNVQLPFTAYFYLNVLTYTRRPDELLAILRERVERTLASSLSELASRERQWRQRAGETERTEQVIPRQGMTLTYAELVEQATQRIGKEAVQAALNEEWARWPATLDKRERSLRLVHRLWRLSGLHGPAVVLYYSPPYYPGVSAAPSALHEAVAQVIAAHPDLHLTTQEYFPYLSDMSYLRLDAEVDTSALEANMPVWQAEDAPPRPGSYGLPLATMRALHLPVVDIGPYGRGAHQVGERLMMSRSFGLLPLLVHETIEQLATLRISASSN
jgi:arginine utilization protein RocB